MSVFPLSSNWFLLLKVFAPAIIEASVPNGAVFGPLVSTAIASAEQIKGATGPDKKAHVLDLVRAGIAALNAVKGHVVVNPEATVTAVSSAIDTTVAVVNLVHKTAPVA